MNSSNATPNSVTTDHSNQSNNATNNSGNSNQSNGTINNSGNSNSNNSTNSNSSNNQSSPNNMSSSSATGATIILKERDDKVLEERVDVTNPSTEYLNVDGKSLRVSYKNSGIYAGTWLNMGDLLACCDKYSSVRFGVIEGGPNSESYFFYNGIPTSSMPTSGTATYHGYTLISGNTPQFNHDDWLADTAQFNADFGAKKLNGTLNVATLDPVNISADISGNSFAGKASSNTFATQANVEGKFYGENAKELGGMFRDETQIGDDVDGAGGAWGGVFGASK
ncbi:Slam-dependent surface lipoprotein [Actinobacillus vicugnae]|uniref:Slam-dependent surface lipoprotein n=1 Tax=Actinobacillus vicugnae TaxID=2573093 RepID=UPI001AD7C8F0